MSEETLFHQALSKPIALRSAFLNAACADDPTLRAAVEALLAAHDAAGNWLDQPLVEVSPTIHSKPGSARANNPAPDDLPKPDAITTDFRLQIETGVVIAGRYTLQEKIGEGGMGEVWVAKQTDPVKRRVALKLIKTGMDSKAVLARFEQERQALALMDHPNIAAVLDGGMTSTGQPFFAMELVNGLPLTKFCDEAKLTPRDRLELFIPICHAVQHAHQKGIVHRDLKPANILVTMIDGRPVPKVIDFGVAKATAGKLTEESLSTQFGAVVGTLEYMSPEQASFSNEDIDTRADIYSLGVILYELLTGLRPFDAKRLQKAAYTEMIRIVREEAPSKPSTRLSTDESLPSLAALRQTEPRKLMALLRGELDWVVMKCLEKQRDRRYETANGLARDIQRYLAYEPVEARPPSVGYRLNKFLQRNKGAVFAAGLVFLTLVGGIVGTTFGMLHAESRRIEAEEARGREAARAEGERNAKEREAARAEGERLAKEREALRADGERKAKEFAAKQQAKAEKARDRTHRVLEDMTSAVTGDSLATQKELSDEQKKFLAEVLSYYKEFAGETAEDEPSRARAALAALRVGFIEYRLGRKSESAVAFRLARDGIEQLLAESPGKPLYRHVHAIAYNSLGNLTADRGNRTGAVTPLQQGLEILEKLVAEFPKDANYRKTLAASHDNLGNLLTDLERRPAAEPHLRKALEIHKKLAAEFPDEPKLRQDLALSHNNLGRLLNAMGNPREAEVQYRQALDIGLKLDAKHPKLPHIREELAVCHQNLGNLLRLQRKLPEADEQLRHSVTILQKLANDYPLVPAYRESLAQSHASIGHLLIDQGKRPLAEAQHRKALTLREELAAEFPLMSKYRQEQGWSHNNLGNLLVDLKKLPEAEEQFRKGLAVHEKLCADFQSEPTYRQELARSLADLGNLLIDLEKWPEAEQHLRKAVTFYEKQAAQFPGNQSFQIDLGRNYGNLGKAINERGKPTDSLEWFEKAIRALTAVYQKDRQSAMARQALRNSHWGRAKAYDRLEKFAEAVKDWDKVIALTPKETQPRYQVAHATSQVKAGRVAEAVAEVAALLTPDRSWPVRRWYECARVYAIASSKSPDQKQKYADRAMELLRRAVKGGYKDAAQIKLDTDLEPLRERSDFKQLLEELEKSATAKSAG